MHVAIIGFGISALSVAWSCHQRGWTVSVHYTSRVGNATQAAGGMLSPSCEADGCTPALIDLANQSCQQYPDWVASIEAASNSCCDYQTAGTLLVALHHDHHQELNHLVAFQSSLGLHSEWLTRKALRRLSPNLTRHVGGLLFADDHHVNPRLLHQALHQALQNVGVQFIEGDPQLEHRDTTATHVFNAGNIYPADAYVVADGAWANAHLALPLRPVKGQYLILAPKDNQPPLLQHVVRTPDVYLIPRANGQIYAGATMEEEGWNTQQTAGATLDFLYHAFQVLPGIYEMNIVESGCGFRPALRDNQPLIGPTHLTNVYANIGHYRHGILLAPAAADLCANAIAKQAAVPDAFSWQRFQSSS